MRAFSPQAENPNLHIFGACRCSKCRGSGAKRPCCNLNVFTDFLLLFVQLFLENGPPPTYDSSVELSSSVYGFGYLSLLFQNNLVDVEVIGMTFEWPTLSAFQSHIVLYNLL